MLDEANSEKEIEIFFKFFGIARVAEKGT